MGNSAVSSASASVPARIPYIMNFTAKEFETYQRQQVALRTAEKDKLKAATAALSQELIVHIDKQSWQVMNAAYGLRVPLLPHRRTRDSTAPAGFQCAP